ncbi:unnamed protein product [Amoebophrya sp. A120]|nr:unnamed protein product [Amoebophrya sp. A120]|eukprot:GSA120T00021862001.1
MLTVSLRKRRRSRGASTSFRSSIVVQQPHLICFYLMELCSIDNVLPNSFIAHTAPPEHHSTIPRSTKVL